MFPAKYIDLLDCHYLFEQMFVFVSHCENTKKTYSNYHSFVSECFNITLYNYSEQLINFRLSLSWSACVNNASELLKPCGTPNHAFGTCASYWECVVDSRFIDDAASHAWSQSFPWWSPGFPWWRPRGIRINPLKILDENSFFNENY